MKRPDGRKPDQLRPIQIQTGIQKDPAGSVQIAFGQTVVLCAASVSEDVPRWLAKEDLGRGWITAEYAMLPGATPGRASRERRGRSEEIQRLIGRSLRAAVDLSALGARTITVDCDVIQADAGTRTAAITGGYVALVLALRKLERQGKLAASPLRRPVCAVSCAIVGGVPVLDPCYLEDHRAEVDMNFVIAAGERLVEVQGTAEGEPFDRAMLDRMTRLALRGAKQLLKHQQKVLR